MRNQQQFIEYKAYQLRRWSLIMTSQAGSGHPTSCLSAADLVAVLFFHVMKYLCKDPRNQYNDKFILSKGHAAPVLYAAWKELGFIDEQELLKYRTFASPLEGHPTPSFAPVLVATGSLGMGLANGVGMGISADRDALTFKTYVLMGDAELTEGSVWEAAALAAHYALANLTAIVDCNQLGQSTTSLYGHNVRRYAGIFESFGWHVSIVDGHNVPEIIATFNAIRAITDKPSVIIANTIKGYGIKHVEGKQGFHGKPFSQTELPGLLDELARRFSAATLFDTSTFENWLPDTPIVPNNTGNLPTASPKVALQYQDNPIATRKAFGATLAAIDDVRIVTCDGDVKNSTFTQNVEEKRPEQFVECFIAEQAMVSIATGLWACKKIPFVATFGSFLTRAHDQLRMASITGAALRVVGSHAGASVGEDGPSQMALEDIAMMRSLHNSVVLYPADAICTQQLVWAMYKYNSGISYLRLTREPTPILYGSDEQFSIGGCKVLKSSTHDSACIISAGITLFEALKAYEHLALNNITVSVIDAYSIKPIDAQTIERVVRQSDSKLVLVEDHYPQGGLGEAITMAMQPLVANMKIRHCAVRSIPGSATAQEQRAHCQIDMRAIVSAVQSLF